MRKCMQTRCFLVAFGAMVPFASLAAQAPESGASTCAALHLINGIGADSSISASRYSESFPGSLGIAVRPGADIGNAPDAIKAAIQSQGIGAECIIDTQEIEG